MRAYLCFGVLLLAVLVSCGQAATKSKVKYIPINLEDNPPPKKILCYYNHEAYKREGKGKVATEELRPALTTCTHLVYAYAGISNSDYHIKSLDKELDTDKNKGHELFKQVTALKTSYPDLNIILGVGGFEDQKDKEKYLDLLDKPKDRQKFIDTTVQFLKQYGFTGVDLAWEFPVVKEKKESTLGSLWSGIKHTITGPKDENPTLHKDHFTLLIREMKAALRPDKYLLGLSVLPHVNYTEYFDMPSITQHVDLITLHAYDFRTPQRNYEEADYSAPLYFAHGRQEHQNANYMVKWFIDHGAELNKLILAIPTYGRTWVINKDTSRTGIPPLKVEGPGEKGPLVQEEGLLSYGEICSQLASLTDANASPTTLRRVPDTPKRMGTYAFRLPNKQLKQEYGIWVSYEDPETVGVKAAYAKQNGLAGVAMVDLSLDDFKGNCGEKYVLVKSAKHHLK
ncbi:hypothetical protein M8J76_014615 [Diaphorina citri]|nr:hypothetical protein M8J75_011316 [Diaphorina citri]KAI5745833.1 hypothetical protein M8J76_014615 [Diaphorina citri]